MVTFATISREFGVPVATLRARFAAREIKPRRIGRSIVLTEAQKRQVLTARKRGRPRKPADAPLDARWANIDWTKQDNDIARSIGRSRERVRQMRKKLGKPKSSTHGQMKPSPRRLAIANALRNGMADMTDPCIARSLGVSKEMVRVVRQKLGIHRQPMSPMRELLDWRLVNADLLSIWGTAGIAARRQMVGSPPAHYDYHTDRAAFHARFGNRTYMRWYTQQIVLRQWRRDQMALGRSAMPTSHAART